jgi:pSer/pThr/pTyr-binding forkhead associated (FHA) protein
MATLVLIYPDAQTGQEFVLAGREVLLGRGENCAVRVQNGCVSRQHARVFNDGDAWVIEDLQSMNGCYVNDMRVKRSVLRDADLLRIGYVIFRFHQARGVITPIPDGGDHGSGAPAQVAIALKPRN